VQVILVVVADVLALWASERILVSWACMPPWVFGSGLEIGADWPT
jgi:hypothetical protein